MANIRLTLFSCLVWFVGMTRLGCWGHPQNRRRQKIQAIAAKFCSSAEKERNSRDCFELKRQNVTFQVVTFEKCLKWKPPFFPDLESDRYRVTYCSRITEVTREVYICEHFCCDGWRKDRHDRCNTRVERCPLNCLNGGHCLRYGTGEMLCDCLVNFSGKRCGEVICPRKCVNGGICTLNEDKDPVCACPKPFSGDQCEKPLCAETCENGGRCSAVNVNASCACPPEFEGNRCQYAVKKGQCPVPDSDRKCTSVCTRDAECAGAQKCCITNCGKQCLPVAKDRCTFGREAYPVGAIFQPHPCKACACYQPDSHQPYECATIPSCLWSRHSNSSVTGPPKPGHKYNAPKIVNCPQNPVTLYLPADRNVATFSGKFVGKDSFGGTLAVSVTPRTFRWKNADEKSYQVAMAITEPDKMGNSGVCAILIRVEDIHAPVFKSCPSDVIASTWRSTVDWPIPEAVDNVGLKGGKCVSDLSPKHDFHTGIYLVTYKAEDLQGNVAFCDFVISVPGSGRWLFASSMTFHMLIATGVCSVIFIFCMILGFYWKRRQTTGAADSPPPAYDEVVVVGGPGEKAERFLEEENKHNPDVGQQASGISSSEAEVEMPPPDYDSLDAELKRRDEPPPIYSLTAEEPTESPHSSPPAKKSRDDPPPAYEEETEERKTDD